MKKNKSKSKDGKVNYFAVKRAEALRDKRERELFLKI